jgi:hypothetical protein
VARKPTLDAPAHAAAAAAAAAAAELLPHLTRVHATRRTLLLFVSCVYSHSAQAALLVPWQKLAAALRGDCSLSAMRAAHLSYLRDISRACFLPRSKGDPGATAANAAATTLSRLLSKVDIFASLCTDFLRLAVDAAAGRGTGAAAARLLATLDARDFSRQVALVARAAGAAFASSSASSSADTNLARELEALFGARR